MNRDYKRTILQGAFEHIIEVKSSCRKGRNLTVIVLMIVFFSLLGCGKKARPRPSGQLPLPVVKDLKITIGRDMFWLIRTIPVAEE